MLIGKSICVSIYIDICNVRFKVNVGISDCGMNSFRCSTHRNKKPCYATTETNYSRLKSETPHDPLSMSFKGYYLHAVVLCLRICILQLNIICM